MGNIRSIRLRELQGRLGAVAYELTKVQFSEFTLVESWRPLVNAYRCRESLRICVDLAGVDKSAIDLQVEPGRLLIRGNRELPEPKDEGCQPLQILALEIDHGFFEREVSFPFDVETERVTAEQKNGLLWIYLPLQTEA
ncbi:MAG: heat shock protein Hsp20 [Pedosphaera sp.]|nr:heat shock protein Hsp20 [Pedosphaera sp.]